jgi:hypothetical protein
MRDEKIKRIKEIVANYGPLTISELGFDSIPIFEEGEVNKVISCIIDDYVEIDEYVDGYLYDTDSMYLDDIESDDIINELEFIVDAYEAEMYKFDKSIID